MKNLLTPDAEQPSLINVKCTNPVVTRAETAPNCTKCPIYQRQIETLQLFLAEWCTTLANELSGDPNSQQLFSRSTFAPEGLTTIGPVPFTQDCNNSETNKNDICFLSRSDTGSNSCSPTRMVINSVINSATSTSASIGVSGPSDARQVPSSISSDVKNQNTYLVATMADCGDRQNYAQINDAKQPAILCRQNDELNGVTISGRPNQQICGSVLQQQQQPILVFDGDGRSFVQHPHVQQQKQCNNHPPLFLKTEQIPAIAAIEQGTAGTLVIRQMPQLMQQQSLPNVLLKVQRPPSHLAVNPSHNIPHNSSVVAIGNNSRQLPVVVVSDLPDNGGPSKYPYLSAHNFTSDPSLNQVPTGMPSSVGLMEVYNSPQLLTSVVSTPPASSSFGGLVLRGLENDNPVTSRIACRPTSTNQQLSDLVPLKLNDEKVIIQLPIVPSSIAALSGQMNNDSVRTIKFVRYPANISQGHSNSGTVAATTAVPFIGTPIATPFAPFTPNANSSVASVSCPSQPSLAISGPIFAVAVSSSQIYSNACRPSNIEVHPHINYSYTTTPSSCLSSVVFSNPPTTKHNVSISNGKITVVAAKAGISSDGTSSDGSLMETGASMIGCNGPISLSNKLSKAPPALFSSQSQSVVVTSSDEVMTTAIQSATVTVPSIDTPVGGASARSWSADNQNQLSQSQHPINKHPSTAKSANVMVNDNYGSTLTGETTGSSSPSHDPNVGSRTTAFGESAPSHLFIDLIDPVTSSQSILGAKDQSGRSPPTSLRSALNAVPASGVRANVASRKRKSSNCLKGGLSKVTNSSVNRPTDQTSPKPEVVSSSSYFSPVSSTDVTFDPISEQCLKSVNWEEGAETRTAATPIGFEFDNPGTSNESKMSPRAFAALLANDPQCTAADAQYEGFFAWKNGSWVCKLCDSTFKKFVKAAKHARSSHLRPNNFSCDKCGKCFDRSSDMKRHVKHAHVRLMLLNYECKICQASFNRKYNLDQHMGTQHPGKVCECPHCGQKFSWERNLARHINQIHPEKKAVGSEKSPFTQSPVIKEESVGADTTLVGKMSQFSLPAMDAVIATDVNTSLSESTAASHAMLVANNQSDSCMLDSSLLKTAGTASFPRSPESNSGYNNCPAVSNYVTSSSRSACFSQLPQSFLSSDSVVCRSAPSSVARESFTSMNEHVQCSSSSGHTNSQSSCFSNNNSESTLLTSVSVSSHDDITNDIECYLVQSEPGPLATIIGNLTPGVATSSLSHHPLGAITVADNATNNNCPTEFVQSRTQNPPQQLPFNAPGRARISDNKLSFDRLCSQQSNLSGYGAQVLTVSGTSAANALDNAHTVGNKMEFGISSLQGQKPNGTVNNCKPSSGNSDCFLSNAGNVATAVEDRTMATVNAVVESSKLRSQN